MTFARSHIGDDWHVISAFAFRGTETRNARVLSAASEGRRDGSRDLAGGFIGAKAIESDRPNAHGIGTSAPEEAE